MMKVILVHLNVVDASVVVSSSSCVIGRIHELSLENSGPSAALKSANSAGENGYILT